MSDHSSGEPGRDVPERVDPEIFKDRNQNPAAGFHGDVLHLRYCTPGSTHSISYIRFAAVIAVLPVVS